MLTKSLSATGTHPSPLLTTAVPTPIKPNEGHRFKSHNISAPILYKNTIPTGTITQEYQSINQYAISKQKTLLHLHYYQQ